MAVSHVRSQRPPPARLASRQSTILAPSLLDLVFHQLPSATCKSTGHHSTLSFSPPFFSTYISIYYLSRGRASESQAQQSARVQAGEDVGPDIATQIAQGGCRHRSCCSRSNERENCMDGWVGRGRCIIFTLQSRSELARFLVFGFTSLSKNIVPMRTKYMLSHRRSPRCCACSTPATVCCRPARRGKSFPTDCCRCQTSRCYKTTPWCPMARQR